MSLLKRIHEFHMQISYDYDAPLYLHVENMANKYGKYYNRKFLISVNKDGYFDSTISLLKGDIVPNKEILSNYLKMWIKNGGNVSKYVRIISNRPSNGQLVGNRGSQYKKYKDIYDKYNTDLYELVMCVYDIIEPVILWYREKSDIHKNDIIGILYFLSRLEWFHMLIYNIMVDLMFERSEEIIISGEYFNIELEYLDEYSKEDILNLFRNEYCSHSIVYLITHELLYCYDPDYDESSDILTTRLAHFLDIKYLRSNIDIPIQSITSDIFCIFHCIEFILNVINFPFTRKRLIDYSRYLNIIIPSMTHDKVIEKINKLRTDNQNISLFGKNKTNIDYTCIGQETVDRIAKIILCNYVLMIGSKQWRICEIEFYIKSKNHNDEYTHGDPIQKMYGKWYFHRYKNKTYKSGTYKGIDITLGNDDTYFGVLIRSIYCPQDNIFIEGPCRAVNKILEEYGFQDVASFMEQFDTEQLTANNKNHFYIKRCRPVELDIHQGRRIGLSDKYPEYRELPYRYATMINMIKKERKHMIVLKN